MKISQLDILLLLVSNKDRQFQHSLRVFVLLFCCRENKKHLAGFLSFLQLDLQSLFENSTMECDCNLFDLKQFIKYEANALIKQASYPHVLLLSENNFQTWTCRVNKILDPDIIFRPFLKMDAKYFICLDDSILCPVHCKCYRKARLNDIVVDCTHNNLTELPRNIPIPKSSDGELIVSLEHNRIVSFVNCDEPGYEWLQHVTSLNLQHNEITPRSPVDINNFLRCLKNITHLYLAYNNIKVLPVSIQEHRYETFSISRNKLICDCTTFWMKSWLQKNKKMIVDSSNLQCLDKCKLVCYNDQYTYQYTIIGSWLKILVKVNIL